jgi:hypothetical protein
MTNHDAGDGDTLLGTAHVDSGEAAYAQSIRAGHHTLTATSRRRWAVVTPARRRTAS